jgi:hypothetical protein
VTPAECRIACNWEYSRDIHRITRAATARFEHFPAARNAASPDIHCPVFYRHAARKLFPQPWLSLTKQQRTGVLDSFCPIPALQVRKLGDFFRHTQWADGAHLDLLRPYLEHAYVIQPNFSLCGVETVIKALETWARKEAKNYPPAPRAKAAALPFDALKWLAVSRLEDARRKARVSFDYAQQALLEYRRTHPLPDQNDVFPIYASHGAWSKARSDARRCRVKLLSQPSFLLSGLI